MGNDTSATAQILLEILTRADLAALQNTAKELTVARTVAKAAGQDLTGLDAALQAVNAELGSKVLDAYIAKTQEEITSAQAAGKAHEAQTQALKLLLAAKQMAAETPPVVPESESDVLARWVNELNAARAAAKAAGLPVEELDAQIRALNADLNSRVLDARIAKLQEEVAAEQAAGIAMSARAHALNLLLSAQQQAAALPPAAGLLGGGDLNAWARANDEAGEALDTITRKAPSATDELNQMSRAQQKASFTFREFHDGQIAWAAFASGNFLFAAEEVTRLLRGITMAMVENPIVMIAAALAAAGVYTYEFFKNLNKQEEEQEKEMVKNAEAAAKATEAAFNERKVDRSDLHEALQQEIDDYAALVAASDEVRDAYTRQREAVFKLWEAKLDNQQANAVAEAKQRGASEEEIKDIELYYAELKAGLKANNDKQIANDKVVAAQQKAATTEQDAKAKEAAYIKEQDRITADLETGKSKVGVLGAARDKVNRERNPGLEKLQAEQRRLQELAKNPNNDMTMEEWTAVQGALDAVQKQIDDYKDTTAQQLAPIVKALNTANEALKNAQREANEKLPGLRRAADAARAAADAAQVDAVTAQDAAATTEIQGQTGATKAAGDAAAQQTKEQGEHDKAQAQTAVTTDEAGILKALLAGNFSPKQKAGESWKGWQQRAAKYRQLELQLENALKAALNHQGGTPEEDEKIHDLLTRLITVVGGVAKNALTPSSAKFLEHEQRLAQLEQQQKNSRVQ